MTEIPPFLRNRLTNDDGAILSSGERERIASLTRPYLEVEPSPMLYSEMTILRENEAWGASDDVGIFAGSDSSGANPGSVDPKKTLLIGQIEYDALLALDFRSSPPSVIVFGRAHLDEPLAWYYIAGALDEILDPE